MCLIKFFYFQINKVTSCKKKCPDGYFENNFKCQPCDKSCATCYGSLPEQCSSCIEPRILYSSQCKFDCPDKLFTDEERRMCVQDCTSFKSNRFGNLKTQKCQYCHSSCLKCNGPTNKECQKCAQTHLLLGNSCLETCPVGYYAIYKSNDQNQNQNKVVQDDCKQCHKNCEDCYGPSEKECRTCAKGLFLYTNLYSQLREQICLDECPDQYVTNKERMTCDECPPYSYFENGQCKNCHFTCLKCFGPSKNNCLECSNNRSQNNKGEPQYGECNCKEGYMEQFKNECVAESIGVYTASRSVTISAITSGSCSIITGLLGTSAFSFNQIIEIAQFTSSLKYANVTFPLNINIIFDGISTSQTNEALDKQKSPPTVMKNNTISQKRSLLNKSELEYMKETNRAPQLWQQFIFTLLLNLLAWLVVLIVNLFVNHMQIKFDDQRIVEKIRVAIQYTVPIQVFIRTSQEGFQFIFLCLYFQSSLSFFGWVCCVYMLITAIAVITIIIKCTFLSVLKKEKQNPNDQDEYIILVKAKKNQTIQYPHPLRTLWVYFKDNRLSRVYYSFMLFLKMLYLIVLSFTSSIIVQMIAMILSKLIFLVYLVMIKPYKYKWYNYMNIFNEALSSIIPLTVLIMSQTSDDNRVVFGWLIMIQLIILFLVNFVYAVIELISMLKHLISKRVNENKIIKINADKFYASGKSIDDDYDLKAKHFSKIAIKNYDEEKGTQNHTILNKQQQGNSNQIQIIQASKSTNYAAQPTSAGIGLQGNQGLSYDENNNIEQYKLGESNNIQNRQNKQNQDDEDYNINSSHLQNQSVLKDDNQSVNESLNASGFPLQVFGKQLEEELHSPVKRKKKNKRKLSGSQQTIQQEGEQIQIKDEEQINLEKEQELQRQKEEQEEAAKQQNISNMIQSINKKLENSSHISPRKIPQRTNLDIIKVIEQQSIKQFKNQHESPVKSVRDRMLQQPSKDSLDQSEIHDGQSTNSDMSIMKEHKKHINNEVEKQENKYNGSNEMSEYSKTTKTHNSKQSQLNSSNIESSNQQSNKGRKDNKPKFVNKDNANGSSNKKLIKDHSEYNTIDQSEIRSEIDQDKKKEKQSQESSNLFEGSGLFKIARVAQDDNLIQENKSKLKGQSNMDQKDEEEDRNKSIVEYIKMKANKAREQKNN